MIGIHRIFLIHARGLHFGWSISTFHGRQNLNWPKYFRVLKSRLSSPDVCISSAVNLWMLDTYIVWKLSSAAWLDSNFNKRSKAVLEAVGADSRLYPGFFQKLIMFSEKTVALWSQWMLPLSSSSLVVLRLVWGSDMLVTVPPSPTIPPCRGPVCLILCFNDF